MTATYRTIGEDVLRALADAAGNRLTSREIADKLTAAGVSLGAGRQTQRATVSDALNVLQWNDGLPGAYVATDGKRGSAWLWKLTYHGWEWAGADCTRRRLRSEGYADVRLAYGKGADGAVIGVMARRSFSDRDWDCFTAAGTSLGTSGVELGVGEAQDFIRSAVGR